MASITLRPISGSGSNWSNIGNAYDGNESTNASVSVSILNYSSRILILNFDTSVIPSGVTINSATLTMRSKAGKTTITAYVNINRTSENAGIRVIEQKQSTSATNYTANVTNYISNLSNIAVTPYNSSWSGNTFELYELWIDVDYTISQTYTVRFLDWNVNVLKTETVKKGNNATPPSNPSREGYNFIGWQGSYTNIIANTDITAQYVKIYNIVASVGTGGTISPSGTTTVDEGSSQTYTISANRGYGIKDVLVDSVSQGAITSYTFTNVNNNHTIEVVFESVPTVIAAIENNVFYAINVFEGYSEFSIGPDGVYLNKISKDLNENESIYLDSNYTLHVFNFIKEDL